MRLQVDPRSGDVVLTVPRRTSQRRALAWAAGHGAWVEAQLRSVAPLQPIVPGATVPLRGVPHVIDWDPGRPRRIEMESGCLRAGGPIEGLERRVLRWLRGEALALLTAETRQLADRRGLKVGRISVGDPVSRWGSCSSGGAIRYSWRLIMAPDFVRRATVTHEVAHLVHLDHSPAFHGLVRDLLGEDPRPARQWLGREGAALHRIGRSG